MARTKLTARCAHASRSLTAHRLLRHGQRLLDNPCSSLAAGAANVVVQPFRVPRRATPTLPLTHANRKSTYRDVGIERFTVREPENSFLVIIRTSRQQPPWSQRVASLPHSYARPAAAYQLRAYAAIPQLSVHLTPPSS